jgi:hypothetical protein
MQSNYSQRLVSSLDMLKAHLSEPLMCSDSFAQIRRVAESLPIFAVEFFGFECRLGKETGLTDCAFNLTPDGAKMLAGQHAEAVPTELQNGSWQRIRSFYQEWGSTRQTAYTDARATWLEFDSSEKTVAPNLLFGYWPQHEETHRPIEWLVDRIIPMLQGGEISQVFRQNLLKCLEARPAKTNDFQIGVMLSRHLNAVRLCVFDLPADEAFTYLETIGWQGPKEELHRYLEAFRPHADLIALHLDIGEKIYPHIGIEPGFDAGCWARQPHMEPRWQGQFEQLGKFGLLAPEKEKALFSWIGQQRFALGTEEILLLRGLSHIKVVLRPNTAPIAKGYFGITHRKLGELA